MVYITFCRNYLGKIPFHEKRDKIKLPQCRNQMLYFQMKVKLVGLYYHTVGAARHKSTILGI